MRFVKVFFSFSFTPNALVYSELRRVGEAVKAIKENLLTCGCTRTRVLHEGACVRVFIGVGDGKVGRKEKESGGGVKRMGEHELKMQ